MITRMFIGVDVSARWFDVCASALEEAPTTRYPNSPEGHLQFIQSLRDLARKHHVCLEHTGGYETPLALACHAAGFTVSLIDGAAFSCYRKSWGTAKAKTDSQDAKRLAKYCKERKPAPWFPVPDEYRQLKELVRHRQRLLESRSGWSCRASRQAEAKLVTAQRQAIVQVLKLQAKAAEEGIKELLASHPGLQREVQLLTSIPGIALVSAVRILAEAGPIGNYNTPQDLALAAGLRPISRDSGTHTPPARLFPYGNIELRCALFFPAVVSYRQKSGVYKFMNRVQSRGSKLKMTVITAGMRKLAHVVWGVLTHGTAFDERKV